MSTAVINGKERIQLHIQYEVSLCFVNPNRFWLLFWSTRSQCFCLPYVEYNKDSGFNALGLHWYVLQVVAASCISIAGYDVTVTRVSDSTPICEWISIAETERLCADLNPYSIYTLSVTAYDSDIYSSYQRISIFTPELSKL